MASPTNKITENQINRLVSENKNHGNPLNMTFAYEYVTDLVPLNWQDMLFAIEKKFLAYETAIDHALIEIQQEQNSPEKVLELACMLKSEAKFPYDVCRLVKQLATLYGTDAETDSREKFLYVSLNWVYEHMDNYCDPVEVVDILCDEMYYPDEVRRLISFMPPLESTTNSPSLEIKQLLDRLAHYLDNQRKYWQQQR
jgi:hypothetical protein